MKNNLRKNCEYLLKAQRVRPPVALNKCTSRSYFRMTDGFVSAYAGHNGVSLTPAEMAYVTRKYPSHRRIPAEELANSVTREFIVSPHQSTPSPRRASGTPNPALAADEGV